jgi:hypothetical protein
MEEYLSFEKMITPLIIQILFWIGMAVSVTGGLWMILGSVNTPSIQWDQVFRGIGALLLGPVVCRVYSELLIVIFRILDELTAIRQHLAPPAGQGVPVTPVPPQP